MMFRRLGLLNKNQKGFTLIELIIVIAITGVLSGVIIMSISQLFTRNAQGNAHMTAIKQVENAIHWMSRDVLVSQIVEPSGDSGFPLNLTWVEFDNTLNQVTYTLEDTELKRSHSVNGGDPNSTVVARHIDPDPAMTNCQSVSGVFTLKVAAGIGSSSIRAEEIRVFEVMPRSAL